MVDWSSYTVFVTEVTSKNMKNMYIFSKNMKVILVAGKIWIPSSDIPYEYIRKQNNI